MGTAGCFQRRREKNNRKIRVLITTVEVDDGITSEN